MKVSQTGLLTVGVSLISFLPSFIANQQYYQAAAALVIGAAVLLLRDHLKL